MKSKVTQVLRLGAIPMLSLSASVSAQAVPPYNIPPHTPYVEANLELETVVLDVTADTSILALAGSRNYGTSRSLDANRALVSVSETAFRSGVSVLDWVASAKLRFTLKPSLLPKLPRTVTAHRMLKSWTETGATWNCAVDANTSNFSNDCSGETDWNMSSTSDAYTATASGSAVLPTFRYGTIEIDVTNDVRFNDYSHRYPENGWLIKADGIDLSALDDFYSRESPYRPQLIMEVRHCNFALCADGIFCTKDFCGQQYGFCAHNSAPPSPCDDTNVCTTNDTCDSSLCIGEPVAAGVECGSGLVCDGAGECVTSPN